MKEKLASFRVDNELWEAFKAIAGDRGTSASCLLVDFIESVVSNRDCIDNSAMLSIQEAERIDEKIKLSIQKIEECIDEKIKLSIQKIEDKLVEKIKLSIQESSPRPTKNQVDSIQKKLRIQGIKCSGAEIREIANREGFDGSNFETIKNLVLQYFLNKL